MRILSIAVLLLVAAAVVCPSVSAAGISQSDYDFFRKKSDAQYGTDPHDLEQQFYWISAGAKNPEVAIDRFSRQLRVSYAAAVAYVDAIIKAVKFRDACGRERVAGPCAFTPNTPLYDALRGAGFIDKSGAVAIVIGKSLPSRAQSADQVRRRFINAIVTHPARGDILRKLFDDDEEPIWEAAHLALDPRDAAFANDVFEKIARGDLYHGSDWSGSRMAALDMARQEVGAAGNTADAYIGYTKAIMALQLRLGLGADAVDTYRKMALRLRGDLFEPEKGNDGLREMGDLALDLAAALFESGDNATALSMLGAYEKTYASKSRKSNFGQWQRYAALREIMSPSLSEDGLYDMFIDGRRPGDPPVKAEESSPHLGQGAGWLFALNLGGPTVRVAAATYLLEHDQRDMAAFLLDYRSYGLSHKSPDSYSANLDLMQADFEARRDHWKARIDQAAQSLRALAKKAETSSPGKSAARPDLPEPYTVHTLPVRYRRDQASPRSQSPHLPNKIDFPVDRRQVVRYEEDAGEHMIIYASSALESSGEVPAEGYWFQRTRDHGKTWERPVYLGLQQYFPYVVVPESELPLLNGDALNIEVRRREIDPASITFPPVRLSFKQDQGNLYLSFDLTVLQRDSDSDGFTDLVERHLGLNPDSTDSDGDGIDDYRDPLPLTAYDPGDSEDDKDFAYAVLHEIVGYDRQAIVVQPPQPGAEPSIEDLLAPPNRPIEHGVMFLIADPKLLAGVRVPFRLLVYKSADDRPAGDGNAPFYPVQILNVFSRRDGSERFVIWSASWTGGSFIVRCKGGKCETKVLSRWIT